MNRKHCSGRLAGPFVPARIRTLPKTMAGVFTYVGPTLDLPSDLGFAPHFESRTPASSPTPRRTRRPS